MTNIESWPREGGAVGMAMRARDWAGTPLGPPRAWPLELRTLVDLMLASSDPVCVVWGPEACSLYNDGYLPLLGRRHPSALGRPLRHVSPELWEHLRPALRSITEAHARPLADLPLALAGRPGRPARRLAFSSTPARDRSGRIAGFYCVARETTEEAPFLGGQAPSPRSTRELEERVAERTRELRELAETLCVAEQQERQRLSRLLHDDLQQLLYGIQMKVAVALEAGGCHAPGTGREHLQATIDLLAEAIRRTRQLTVDLNPPILEGEGLLEAVEWLRTHMWDLHGLRVEIRSRDEVELPSADLRILLFQVTRELLGNVARHAGTARAVVELSARNGRAQVVVEDCGRGFDPDRVGVGSRSRFGLGLVSARERLRMRGGDLEIRSAPLDGTRVVAYAPVGDRSKGGYPARTCAAGDRAGGDRGGALVGGAPDRKPAAHQADAARSMPA